MTLTSLPSGIDMGELRKLAATAAKIQQAPGTTDTDGLVPAISYLRVSTKDQATRNGLEEGLSIPAQRKADQLGAVIVKEFIEPGESAKTAQRRALQNMLDYVTENPVQYCIINKADRLARNRLDDAIIHATLRDANISLVSVTENIDETPSGMLMRGILASMAEFYSLNLAQEVLKGMTQKASMGGTPAKAPLGYLNVRTTEAKGHEIRDVTLDPERGDLVTFAFTAYATGDWTLSSLAAELEARGLTTRPAPSFPSKPVTTKAPHKILTNPYYQGSVTFRGVTYDGAHHPLVDTETWLRVQTELAAKNQRGEKPRTHDHYLKGTLYCSCGAKMMIECPTGKSGITFEYFTCSGRRKKNGCKRSAILTDRIEDRIDSTYGTNGLTSAEADRVREVLGAVLDQLEATTDDERAFLTTQKEKLDAERLKLVQAHYADAIPLDLLKSEQERIRTTLDAIEHRLENLATSYEDAREGLDQLADILTDLGDVYARCEPTERRILNRALFDKIILDDEETIRYQPDKAVRTALDCVTPGHTPIAEAEASDPEDTSNPARVSAGQGSKMSLLVEHRGIEPLTFALRTRRSTN